MLTHRTFLLSCVIAAFTATLAVQSAYAQLSIIHPQQFLPTPPDPDPSESFFRYGALAVTDGKTILVSVEIGRTAYAYSKSSHGRWVYESTLTVPAPQDTASTGIAVRGNTALVQGSTPTGRAAFVFQRRRGVWTYTQTLSNASGSLFRRSPLALGHDFAAVGSYETDDLAGAVFIYDKAGAERYVFGTKLAPATATRLDFTGATVVVDRNSLLTWSGRTISSFVREGAVWLEEPSLRLPSGGVLSPDFGYSGNRAVVSGFIGGGEPARVFIRDHDGIWSVEQTLTNPVDPQTNLGPKAAIDGRRLLITDTSRGAVYVFERHKAIWVATAELALPSSCEPLPTVALSRRLAVVACQNLDTGDPIWQGRVLIYELSVLSEA
jgi:hypothetical protein